MANRCYALTIEGIELATYRANVLHFQSTGTNDNDTLAAAESLVSAWNASIKALWLATLPAEYSLFRLSARRVDLKPSAVGTLYFGKETQTGTRYRLHCSTDLPNDISSANYGRLLGWQDILAVHPAKRPGFLTTVDWVANCG